MWTRALESADASCGGKAFGLARLIAAGLPVPAGFVIDDRAFRVATGDAVRQVVETGERSPLSILAMHRAARSGPIDQNAIREAEIEVGAVLEPDPGISLQLKQAGPDDIGHTLGQLADRIMKAELPADLVDEVTTRARRLGGPFVVRSSAIIEDGEAGAAAGVFSSQAAVTREALWEAIRSVWVSALTPLAAAYARRRGGEIAISVIVQKFAEGERVTVYTRPPGAPQADQLWWQHAGGLTQIARTEKMPGVAAERAIGATAGADVEMIVPWYSNPGPEPPFGDGGSGLDWDRGVYVQARPIVHPVFRPRVPPPPTVLAILDDGRRWTLDVAHNPDPLSTAQADLVDRVEQSGAAPWSSRVVAGYLYTSPRATPTIAPPASADDLVERATAIEQRMVAALDARGQPGGLAAVLERYLAFYRIWAHELGPLIAAVPRLVPVAAGMRVDATEAWLLAAARGELPEQSVSDLLSVLAPSWDVATSTFGEQPRLIRAAIERARNGRNASSTNALPDPPDPSTATVEYFEFRDRLHATRDREIKQIDALAANLAERDDFSFAVAQWTVRRAIAQRADELGIAREDAFWISLDDLVRGEIDPTEAIRHASGARAAAARATSWEMPIVVSGSVPDSSTRNSGVALRGFGSGHVVVGRVRRFESLASAIVVGRGDIVVTRAVTPALAVIVIGCAAIISETGQLLDHGAAMARELGIPCVVGCRDAWSQLADGMMVAIERDAVSIVH